MAPVRTPGRKRREEDYSGIGHYGRKTGVTVPDLGPRDEFGLEPVENLFSSPRYRGTPRSQDDTAEDGNDMDMDDSTQLEPDEILSSVRHIAQILPTSRSPIKTKLGSSPRRSIANTNSTKSYSWDLSGSVTEQPSQPRRTPVESSKINGAVSNGIKKPSLMARGDRSPLSTQRTFNFMDDMVEMNGDENMSPSQHIDNLDNDRGPLRSEISGGFDNSDDWLPQVLQDENTLDANIVQQSNSHLRRGNKRKSEEEPQFALSSATAESGENRKDQSMIRQMKRKKRQDMTISDIALGKQHRAVKDAMADVTRNKMKKGLSRRVAHTSFEPATRQSRSNKELSLHGTSIQSSKSRLSSQPLNLQQEPSSASVMSSSTILRSGRTSVRPLAFWRGEQIVYEAPRRIGKDVHPGGYGGVDPGRVVSEKGSKSSKRKKRSRQTRSREPYPQMTDSDQEEWETEGEQPGVLSANVFAWDPEMQRSIEEGHEEIEIALAPVALDERTQWDKGQTFKFGKTLTLPFFHSGIVDLPPGGEKRPKNSRKNHMIFWVFSGRVQVDVSGNVFSVGTGGMWQVPRGNSYGLSNPYSHDVRIFFAQGSYMEQPENEAALVASATRLPQ